MDVSTLYGIAAVIGAISSLVAAIGTLLNGRAALVNREVGERSVAASMANSAAIGLVANQVAAVDVKVDGVTEQTNGHLTTLIATVAAIDPAAAEEAAAKIVHVAEKTAAKLAAIENEKDTP